MVEGERQHEWGRRPPEVLLDTNFLLVPFKHHVDIFGEMERLLEEKARYLVLASVLQELRSLKGREKMWARAMLQFIFEQSGKFEIIAAQGKTDKLILEFAERNNGAGFFVATLDKALREKLHKMRVRTILLRDKGHLEIY